MVTDSIELGFVDWLAKVNERLTFARLKSIDGKDMNEDEEALYKELFRIYYEGRYPIFVTKMSASCESVMQGGLFPDNSTVNPVASPAGTEIENGV